MTRILKQTTQRLLKLMAKIYLRRVKPRIIVIAGTANRHWIKEKAGEALKQKGMSCRANRKNFNAEIGLPLSVLGLSPDTDDGNIFKRWFKTIYNGAREAGAGQKVDYLILELAIDKPRDMQYLLSIVRPDIAIFTTLTMIYPENFENLDAIAKEYRKLVKVLPENGLAVLNADDDRILKLKDAAKCQFATYGIENKNSDYLADEIQKNETGQSFKLHTPDLKVETIEIGRFGLHHIYAELVKKIINDNI